PRTAEAVAGDGGPGDRPGTVFQWDASARRPLSVRWIGIRSAQGKSSRTFRALLGSLSLALPGLRRPLGWGLNCERKAERSNDAQQRRQLGVALRAQGPVESLAGHPCTAGYPCHATRSRNDTQRVG